MSYNCDYYGKNGILGGMVMTKEKAPVLTRRDFLGMAATGTFLASLGAASVGMLNLVRPSVMPEPSRRYKIGEPGNFPPGEVRVPPGKNVFLFHDENGFYAISAICTHLGCTVSRTPEGFDCPCHGSSFAQDGRVVSGAAAKALDWFAMSLAPDGQLVVDEAKMVKPGTYFKI
jgi:cytochrome b6-f complex iron-sulfur subunit